MIIRFTKAKNEDRPSTITCFRDDGTTTGMPSTPFFVRHDLTHYAVETVLGLRTAFFGLLAQGWEISSFEEREPGNAQGAATATGGAPRGAPRRHVRPPVRGGDHPQRGDAGDGAGRNGGVRGASWTELRSST
jgi:hypothetical protein